MKEKNIIEAMEDEFIPYAGEILVNNIPSVTDGLLPVHRKVEWALHRNGINPEKPFIKLLRAGAYTMVYYVFGDMPLYKSMKNMANNSLNNFYLEPKGSFGDKRKKDGVGASPRYIECKLSEYGKALLYNINKNNVEFKRNFDNTENEPITLPSIIPNVLTNTSQSIAVGEASKIPAHNLIETCDSFISYIKTKDIDKSIEILKCPDFSLGGQIPYNKNTFENIYKTGKGSFSIIGKYKYDEKKSKITIYEVPYETYIENIEDKIAECIEKGLFKEITDYHNASDKDGIALDIYIKKNTDVNKFIAKLRKYTPFESKFACNFTLLDLDNKTPLLMTLEDIIVTWTTHRETCIIKEYEYDIAEKEKTLHSLYGLQIINEDLDKAIQIIKTSKKESIALENLIEYFKLTKEQAEYIATIRLVNINEEWIINKIKNITKLGTEIKQLNREKSDMDFIHSIIISQLGDIKKQFGKPRLTEIIYNDKTNLSKSSIVEEYGIQIVLTKSYLKKNRVFSEQQKLKDNDKVLEILSANNTNTIILLSNQGRVFNIKANDLETCKPSEMGEFIPNLIELNKAEKIIKIAIENQQLFILTAEGKGLRLNSNDMIGRTKQYIKLETTKFDNNEVVGICEYSDIIKIATEKKKNIEYNVSDNKYKGNLNNTGSFVHNCRQKKDRVIKLIK
jgi:DNA gyrase/topoisomerase IV subunit A